MEVFYHSDWPCQSNKWDKVWIIAGFRSKQTEKKSRGAAQGFSVKGFVFRFGAASRERSSSMTPRAQKMG